MLAHLLLACTSPDGGGADGPSFSISLSQGELEPAFDPDVLHYAIAEQVLVDATTTVTASDESAILEHRTIDGAVLAADAGSFDVPLAVGEYVRVSAGDRSYQLTVVPTAVGPLHAEGVASEGAILIATFATPDTASGVRPHLLILDERGVPLWYRETPAPAYDFHATGDGRLLYIGAPDTAGWRGIVLGTDYAVERIVNTLPGAGGEAVQADMHFFDLYGDDMIFVGKSGRPMDLTPYGADEGCCTVLDYVIQQIGPDDTVAFEWNTKNHLDFSGVPEAFFEDAHEVFEYAHLNSWQLDPADDTWIVSTRWTSQVLRLAPRDMTWEGTEHAAGDILERIGGEELSDYTFVDDVRPLGWTGFMTQHSARVVAPDRLLVYDNGSEPDLSDSVADSRAVEYALDRSAGTATRVWDTSAEGAGSTLYGGSVQRLPDGSTLIGWASLPALTSWGPEVTEVDPEGEVAFTLTIADGLMTYRASKAILVDGRWTAP